MFCGIIETTGIIEDIEADRENRIYTIASNIAPELKVDQSLAHDGVCLTVEKVDLEKKQYQITAIAETLNKTNLTQKRKKDRVNLERSMSVDSRIDGHFVQGHVDGTGTVEQIEDQDGSWEYFIRFPADFEDLIVSKGSIALNGVSLTVVQSQPKEHIFSVCIIPYTYDVTNISDLKIGDRVNLEFDILGKYVQKILSNRFNAG